MGSGRKIFVRLLLSSCLFCAPSFVLAAPPPVRAQQQALATEAAATAVVASSVASNLPTPQEYVLGTGDRIKLSVYGESDISGEYEIASTGVVALPLIGDVPAANQPVRVFEQAVRTKLSDGYLHDPRVSVQVINYRPFFILGEVSKPGSYPYVNGMTVVNAVALAGGYTYRADKGDISVTRANDPQKNDVEVEENEAIMPGDIIRVPERFF